MSVMPRLHSSLSLDEGIFSLFSVSVLQSLQGEKVCLGRFKELKDFYRKTKHIKRENVSKSPCQKDEYFPYFTTTSHKINSKGKGKKKKT